MVQLLQFDEECQKYGFIGLIVEDDFAVIECLKCEQMEFFFRDRKNGLTPKDVALKYLQDGGTCDSCEEDEHGNGSTDGHSEAGDIL